MADTKATWRIDAEPHLSVYMHETWAFRRIAVYLAWRDVLVRFKQTAIGAIWVLARPLLVALAFVFVFSHVAGLSSGGTPYLPFVLVALLPWQFLASVIGQGAESIVANAGMITKIYFPRALLPAAVVLANLFDLLLSIPVLFLAFLWFSVLPPASALVWAPIYLVLIATFGFGVATLLAVVNALYRDVRHLVPFVLQFGLYLSPIGYGVGSVPENMRSLYCLNPLVALFEGLRTSLLGTPYLAPDWALPWSIAVTIVVALGGILCLLYSERRLVDVI
jgi:lipopolysaccharide transport system permease protein